MLANGKSEILKNNQINSKIVGYEQFFEQIGSSVQSDKDSFYQSLKTSEIRRIKSYTEGYGDRKRQSRFRNQSDDQLILHKEVFFNCNNPQIISSSLKVNTKSTDIQSEMEVNASSNAKNSKRRESLESNEAQMKKRAGVFLVNLPQNQQKNQPKAQNRENRNVHVKFSISKILTDEIYLDEIMLFKLRVLQNYINVDNEYTKQFPIMMNVLPNRVKIKRQPLYKYNKKRKDTETLNQQQNARKQQQLQKPTSITLEYYQISVRDDSFDADNCSFAKKKFKFSVEKIHQEVMKILHKIELNLSLNNMTHLVLKFIQNLTKSYKNLNKDEFDRELRCQLDCNFKIEQIEPQAIKGKN